MSNSPLVDYINISPNRTSPRNHKIDTITIHCVVGQCSVESLGAVFKPTSRQGSSNYGIGSDGRIGMYVEEKDRSWCSGGNLKANGMTGSENDHRAITIECASDTTHPYAINDKVYKSLIELCTDICKRNGIKELKWKGDKNLVGKIDQQNMTVHRWFANKACPGDYIYERLGQIANEVNKKLKSSGTSSNTISSNKSFLVKVDRTDLNIRRGPGTNYIATGFTGKGIFTITETKSGTGSKAGWGKLKSGAGWISLDYVTKI